MADDADRAQIEIEAELRLARLAAGPYPGENPTVAIERSYSPRIQGAPFSSAGWTGNERLQAHLTYYTLPEGSHGGEGISIYCEKWANFFYEAGLIGRFLATGGRDLHYLTRPGNPKDGPKGHTCLGDLSCDFINFWNDPK